MAIVLPNVSKIRWLTAVLALNTPFSVKLFTNSPTIGNATVVGDFTEATFTGYSAQAPTFGAVAIDGSNHAASSAGVLTFTLTAGSQTINGFWIEDSSGNLLGAATFSVPVALTTTVPDLRLTITLTETTE